jgi:hypothetical protein
MIRIITAFCFLIALSGCTKPTGNDGLAKKSDIRTALSKLLERQNDDAFVIIEDRKSKKFVQFAGGAEYGIQMEEWEVYDQPGGYVE